MREYITSRNLAGALSYLGADVESALLAISVTAPVLDAKVRAALYSHSEKPKLRLINSRMGDGLILIDHSMPKHICVMHAVDHITQVIDDSVIVKYLKTKFPDYDIKELICKR